MDSNPIVPLLSRSLLRNESDVSMPKEMKKFYQGEPLALGVVVVYQNVTPGDTVALPTLLTTCKDPESPGLAVPSSHPP